MQVQLIGAADFEDMDMEQQQQQQSHNHVGFSQRRNASLQRSQDSGALTDWSGGSRGSPTRQSLHSLELDEQHKYVTVLTVNGGLEQIKDSPLDDFVTVLSVGAQKNEDDGPSSIGAGSVCLSLDGFVEEVACVTRRPGQKLGFGLKFDGGNECDLPIQRLFIQSCAEGSPASTVHCSWGRLVEADEIVEIGGVNIRNTLNRLQVVKMLKDSQQEVLSLKIRHYWDDSKRADLMEHLNNFSPAVESKPAVTRKVSARQQERAVDVPEEFLTQSVMRIGQRKGHHHQLIDESPPPVPPRRKRRSKIMHKGTTGSISKTVIGRSLSSDEVLINGNRVAATSAVANTPSKPPRNNRPLHTRSFNATHHDVKIREECQAPATLPRTFIGQQPEPKERNRRSILTVNADDWGIPQAAEVYINLIAEEDKRLIMSIEASSSATESESESNSSVSTVVDNWSVLSSSSGGDPFGDFSEHEEFREFYHQPSDVNRTNKLVTDQQQLLPDVVTPSESTLSVLIQPPETFLDAGPTSISPSLSNEENSLNHQDASSDSGASSGGSELHLGESDEELRAFQQMENALEMEKLEHECNAVPPAVELFNNNNYNLQVSGVIERSEQPTVDSNAICVPNSGEPSMECQPEEAVKVENAVASKKVEQPKKSGGSRLNLNPTPLRSRIPQAVSTPCQTRNVRPLANNNKTTSNIVAPKVVNKTSSAVVVRNQNNHNNSQPISRMLLAARTTPNHQRVVVTSTSPTNLLKSVKPGLSVSTSPATTPNAPIQGSRIPRPSSCSSGGQPKISPSASSARLHSAGLSAANRHPSSPSLQANNRTTGVKSCPPHLHKSTSRLHLTHNNKGSLIRADMVSAH